MDTIVRIVGLPLTVRGMVVKDEDGNCNIYINKNLSYEMQRITYQHEAKHIERGDLYSEEPAVVLENRTKYG